MENCFKTSLKTVVQNGSLKKLGELNLLIATNATWAGIAAGAANLVQATLIGGTANGESNYYVPTGTGIKNFVAEQGATIIKMGIDDKYHITSLSDIWPKNIDDICYCPITAITTADNGSRTNANLFENLDKWDFKNLSDGVLKDTLTTLKLWCNSSVVAPYLDKIVVPLDVFGKFGNLESFKVMWLNTSGSTGTTGLISDLGNCTKLTEIALSDCKGSLESFVAKQRLAGKTINSTGISMDISNSDITFNGEHCEQSTLTWTENSITYNGVTISA